MPYLDSNGVSELWARCKAVFSKIGHTHNASTELTGVLPITNGGTGSTTAASARTNLGITYANLGVVPTSQGGTSRTTHTTNALLTGNGTGQVLNVSTASGACYATASGGASRFGTLPVAQGGTGATTASTALTNLGAASSELIREVSTGTLVGKTGKTYGTLINSSGTVDTVALTWSGTTPTVGASVVTSGPTGIDVNKVVNSTLTNLAHYGTYVTVGTRLSGSTVGNCSVAVGDYTTASGYASAAFGGASSASGEASFATGEGNASGQYSSALGARYDGTEGTIILGSRASGIGSHADSGGFSSGNSSHADSLGGASETAAHGECGGLASGAYSYAGGQGAEANHRSQHVFGEHNVVDPSTAAATERGTYVEIVGNGTSDTARSNARTLDFTGNEWLAGALKVGDAATTRTNLGLGTAHTVITGTAANGVSVTRFGNFCWLNVVEMVSTITNYQNAVIATLPEEYIPSSDYEGIAWSNENGVAILMICGTSAYAARGSVQLRVNTGFNVGSDYRGIALWPMSSWQGSVPSSSIAATVVANLQPALVDLIYPIGSYYISTDSTSPATRFGGTWSQVEGKFILAADGTYVAGSTGGEATHILTIDEIPAHSHTYRYIPYTSAAGYGLQVGSGAYEKRVMLNNADGWPTGNTGGGAAHNNMPPYIAAYVWMRTA
jgi:hypothetical protein